MNQAEYIGFESVNELAPILSRISPQRIFLVTGRNSFTGAQNILDPFLKSFSKFHYVYGSPNPKIEDIENGIQAYRQINPDMVIAVGGGSVMDTAKLINFFAVNTFTAQEWLNGPKNDVKKGPPLIAITTTAGSGSEATHFSVLYIDKEKYSVEHETMLPDIAIVDPVFTLDLPPYIKACSGMDALSQAIESYWNVNSTETSKQFAEEAIKLISANIKYAVKSPTPDNLLAMAQGAHLAGKAIRLTKTTAVHAISYPITSYFGIAHGHACSLILPSMFCYIEQMNDEDCADPRGREYVLQAMKEINQYLGHKVPSAEIIIKLLKEIGLETNLNSLGIKSDEDIDTIIKNGFNPQRVKNNPRLVTKESLRHLLLAIVHSTS